MTKFSTISLYLTKLYVTYSFAIVYGHWSHVQMADIIQNLIESCASYENGLKHNKNKKDRGSLKTELLHEAYIYCKMCTRSHSNFLSTANAVRNSRSPYTLDGHWTISSAGIKGVTRLGSYSIRVIWLSLGDGGFLHITPSHGIL